MFENEDLEKFHEEIYSQIEDPNELDSKSMPFAINRFFEYIIEKLNDEGAINEKATFSDYILPNGRAGLTGYNFNFIEDDSAAASEISLYDCNYSGKHGITEIHKSDIEKRINKLINFFFFARDEIGFKKLEPICNGFIPAKEIYDHRSEIKTVHLYIITDEFVKMRKDVTSYKQKDIIFQIHIVDIQSINNYINKAGREEIIFDFEDNNFSEITNCNGLQCLSIQMENNAEYNAYLAVIRGDTLATLYEYYGSRMLESNVRGYLQARGKVNKGIINTIETAPEKFFAYNNGISAIAEDVVIRDGKIIKMKNFQIVNGGQTTASLYYAIKKKQKSDGKEVFVQMKLSEIYPESDYTSLVTNIAKFANSQNKINESDFFSAHPYCKRLVLLSKEVKTPINVVKNKQSHWYFESSRGAYESELFKLKTSSEIKKFKLKYPKDQKITITELSKYLSVWKQIPYIVSRGAQFVTASFQESVDSFYKEHNKDVDTIINESYFKHVVAKAIIFRAVDKIVKTAEWFRNSFKANIVAYSLSYLSYRLDLESKEINYSKIWQQQDVSDAFKEMIYNLGRVVLSKIIELAGEGNVTQYCKKKECWLKIQEITFEFTPTFLNELVDKGTSQKLIKASKKDQKISNELYDEIAFNKLTAKDAQNFLAKAKEYKIFITQNENNALKAILFGRGISSYQANILKKMQERVKQYDLYLIQDI